VYLDNTSPNATLDYSTGTATNTVSKDGTSENATENQTPQSSVQAQTPESSVALVQTTAANTESTRTVYVTGGGKSSAYWYSKEAMPKSTNMNNIVEMTEKDAIAQGKHHSKSE
jgi:DNA-entry nuclease